jgi:hypothetical protein
MRQLRCPDLAPGDILLKISDGSLVSRAISFGQNLVGQLNPAVVHAGVLFDKTFMIEAQGGGIRANDLRVQNKPYGYLAYRPLAQNLAAGAATCAKMMFDIQHRHGNLGYNLGGAVGSLFGGSGSAATATGMDRLLDRILEGKNHPFFCSQLVIYVYQFVGEQNGIPASSLFSQSDAKVSPSVLASSLVGHSAFQEVGYLLPGER